MNDINEFTKLMYMARNHMEENDFSPTTVSSYMRAWRSIYNFGISQGITEYSAELVEQYMLEKYHCSIGEKQIDGKPLTPYMQQKCRALQALTEFKLHGYVPKVYYGGIIVEWPEAYERICIQFLAKLKYIGLADQTLRKHEIDLFRFVQFLSSQNIAPNNIKAENIYAYYKTLIHYAKPSLATIRSTLCRALRFFYQHGVTPEDLSEFVPKIHYYAKAKIDKVWSEEEISKMLNSIDRANAVGKRDYAIMLIAANLGLRTGDIIALKIENFDWNHGCINIVQQKTKEPLTLPIQEQIGKAVIDYWMNGRPKTKAAEIFVEHTLPYQKLTNGLIYHIFNKYYESSGIVAPSNRQHGLHSLRHSLASRLLEKDTPVNVISNILGHVDSDSAKSYLQIDIERLRQCSLEVPDYV